jgi:murein DD-endopeptidase MepM/ murein hydrolase activator NlpD
MRRTLTIVAVLLTTSVPAVVSAPAAFASAVDSWTWPVAGPVTRGFDPPDSPYGSGHRGIDIATADGTSVVSVGSGVVSFAGSIGADLFISVDHGAGIVSSYAYLSLIDVHKGDLVPRGTTIGRSGEGHAGVTPSHLHFGLRLDGEYVDPLAYLPPPSVVALIRLAPLDE